MNKPMTAELHPEGAAFIDGCIVPIAQARLPLLDWGFLHSDATYDVVHVRQGAFFRLNDHLDRFERGMQKLHMELHIDRAQILDILLACVRATGLQNAYVEMICTRGVPIAAVDGISLPDGSPGPQTQQIKDLYWQMHTRPQHRLYVYDTQAD